MKIYLANVNGFVNVLVESDEGILRHDNKKWRRVNNMPNGTRLQIYPKCLINSSLKMRIVKLFLTEWGFDSLTQATQFVIEHLPHPSEDVDVDVVIKSVSMPIQKVEEKEVLVEDISPVEELPIQPEKDLTSRVFSTFNRFQTFKNKKDIAKAVGKRQSDVVNVVNRLVDEGWVLKDNNGYSFNKQRYSEMNSAHVAKFNNIQEIEVKETTMLQKFDDLITDLYKVLSETATEKKTIDNQIHNLVLQKDKIGKKEDHIKELIGTMRKTAEVLK